MNPLRYVVLGFVLIYADVSIRGSDLLFDPAGWAFVLFGLQQLVTRHPSLVVPRNATAVGLVVSLALSVVSFGGRLDLILETALQITLFFTLCTALRQVVERPEARLVFDRARWIDLACTLGAILLLLVGLVVVATTLLLVDLGIVAWAMYWAWTVSRSAELQRQ